MEKKKAMFVIKSAPADTIKRNKVIVLRFDFMEKLTKW